MIYTELEKIVDSQVSKEIRTLSIDSQADSLFGSPLCPNISKVALVGLWHDVAVNGLMKSCLNFAKKKLKD